MASRYVQDELLILLFLHGRGVGIVLGNGKLDIVANVFDLVLLVLIGSTAAAALIATAILDEVLRELVGALAALSVDNRGCGALDFVIWHFF